MSKAQPTDDAGLVHCDTLTELTIQRCDLPPIPVPAGVEIADWHTAAVASAGQIQGEVLRFDYFDPFDGRDYVEHLFEVRIDGLPETCGVSNVMAEHPELLEDLAGVCHATAAILREHQQVDGR
jgi:hypothetical protein